MTQREKHEQNLCFDYAEYQSAKLFWESRAELCLLSGGVALAAGLANMFFLEKYLFNFLSSFLSIASTLIFFLAFLAGNYCYKRVDSADEIVGDPEVLAQFRRRYINDKHQEESDGKPRPPRVLTCILLGCVGLGLSAAVVWAVMKIIPMYLLWPTSLKFFTGFLLLFITGVGVSTAVRSVLVERVKTLNGEVGPSRLRTGALLVLSLLCIPMGFWLVTDEVMIGAALVLTLCPCLLLYPLIRGLFYGGRDSPAALITTIVTEEIIKGMISSSIKKAEKKKQRR